MIRKFCTRSFVSKFFRTQYSTKIRRERITPNDFLWKSIESSNIKSKEDWENVRSEILKANGPITSANIDAMTVGICISKKEYNLALSYLDYLKKDNFDLNLATLGKYFKLFYAKSIDNGELDKNDEERIISLYKNVRKRHPILDALTLENIIQALSLTSQWKLCIELLEEVKISATPTSNSYNVITAAAFSNNEDEIAWKFLNELIEKDKSIHSVVYSSYFKKASEVSNTLQFLEKMFNFMQENNIRLESDYVNEFVEPLRKIKKIIINPSVINQSGICKQCRNKLKLFELTEDEFSDLKTHVIQNVIIGKNVFNKSTPEELEKFRNFVTNMVKFDVIVDGLNVAYSAGVNQPVSITSGLVAAVVSHFARSGKKVLLFGRNHMSRWPKNNWSYINQNSTVFLTENLSQDDPYLLFSALNSGKDTIIVTRDLMRGHKVLLNSVRLKSLFNRWLTQRQYLLLRVINKGTPIFKKPLPYDQVAQKNGNCWHIPCITAGKVPSTNTNWLCIKI